MNRNIQKNDKRLWDAFATWDQAQNTWENNAQAAQKNVPIKTLRSLPKMEGISKESRRFLKWKSLIWMIRKDHQKKILTSFLKHPILYSYRYIRSLFQKKSYLRKGDFFLYGLTSNEEFSQKIMNLDSLFVVGFSYCHKPFECPSGRFTSDCIHDANHPVCQQCFIGKAYHALPQKNTVFLAIPTVHYIGEKILELVDRYPKKQILFLITACEMTLEMFGDWGNMAGIKGIGIRLDGRICNTMKAFALSEEGIKPGLTVVLDDTQKQILNWIRERRESQFQ